VSALILDGSRANRATVVDGQGVHVSISRAKFRRGGRDGAVVVDGVDCGVFHGCGRGIDENVFVAGLLDQHALGGGQTDGAAGGIKRAFVIHGMPNEINIPPKRVDRSQILHAVVASAAELQLAGAKILVRDVLGAGGKSSRIHRARATDEDAIAVDDKNLTVGIERAVDARNAAARDAIQHRAAAAWLEKGREFARVDGERIPVDNRYIARLLDRHSRGAGAGNRR